MCWMTTRHGDDASTEAIDAIRRHERANGHSWGIAAIVDGEIQIEKGVGEVPEHYVPPESEHVIAHTRFATRGEISERNAHPFPIEDEDGETVAALCHNGTWRDAPDEGDRCDSWHIAQLIEEQYQDDLSLEAAIQVVAYYVGETILVLTQEGTVYTYAGRYDITIDLEDAAVASSGLDIRIPKGKIIATP